MTPKNSYAEAVNKLGGGSLFSVTGSKAYSVSFVIGSLVADDYGTIKMPSAGETDVGTIKRTTFKERFNAYYTTNPEKLGDFSKVEIIDEGSIGEGVNATKATFTIQFTLKYKSLEVESGNWTFKLESDIKNNYDKHPDSVKWE